MSGEQSPFSPESVSMQGIVASAEMLLFTKRSIESDVTPGLIERKYSWFDEFRQATFTIIEQKTSDPRNRKLNYQVLGNFIDINTMVCYMVVPEKNEVQYVSSKETSVEEALLTGESRLTLGSVENSFENPHVVQELSRILEQAKDSKELKDER